MARFLLNSRSQPVTVSLYCATGLPFRRSLCECCALFVELQNLQVALRNFEIARAQLGNS